MEKEINKTPETMVKELALVSGTPFEVAVTELHSLAEKAKAIQSVEDPTFKDLKSEMVAKRNYIKTYCLDARRDIKKVAEGVSEVENLLLEIFVPQEDRLAEMTKEAKEKKERDERAASLPDRKEALAEIGDEVEVTDEELLEMTDIAFSEYKIARQNAKIEADKAEIEKARQEQEDEKKRLEWEAGAQEREAEARRLEEEKRQEEIELAAQERLTIRGNALRNFGLVLDDEVGTYKMGEDQMFVEETFFTRVSDLKSMTEEQWSELLTKLVADKDRRTKAVNDEATEKAEADMKAKREKQDKYRQFRADNGWTEETAGDFYEDINKTEVVLYKKVGVFDLTQ